MVIRKVLLILAGAIAVVLLAGTGIAFVAYDRNLYVSESGPRPELYMRGGTLFDATGVEPAPNPGILVRDGVIVCIGAACAPSDAAIEIDASGFSILPGLIDLHGHFFGLSEQEYEDLGLLRTIWSTVRFRPGFRRRLLESGVTSFRSVGDVRDGILEVKRILNGRELGGPRMFVAGPIFTAPGGHPAYGGEDPNRAGFGGAMTFQSNDPHEVSQEIAILAEQGVDGIKAVYHGAVSADGEILLPTLSADTMRALMDTAEAHGLWVAVHTGPREEVAEAVRAGATTIEHGVRQGNLIDDETLQLLVENDVVYVPTLGREPRGHLNIPALHAAGVTLGVGTDGEDFHEEVSRMAEAGLPAAEVVLAATANGARALGVSDRLGTVEQGKLADIILVTGEPWIDILDLRSVAVVVQDGYLVVDKRMP